MNRLLMLFLGFFALALPTTFASPAEAQTTIATANSAFTGLRGELNASVSDVRNVTNASDISYGAEVGVDIPLGPVLTIGAEGTAANVFNDDRILGVGARVGLVLVPNRVLVFAGAGYENYRDATFNRNLDGLRVSGGAELALTQHFYVTAEGRYSDLNANTGRIGALVGAGLRF